MQMQRYNFYLNPANYIIFRSEKYKFIWFIAHLFVPLESPNVLSLDNKNKKNIFCFVLSSLIRTFASEIRQIKIWDAK